MGAMGKKIRNTSDGIVHACPACNEIHHFTTSGSTAWMFDGNREAPTFSPSMKVSYHDGRVCHYILTAGIINYCGDSTHGMAGKSVPLPDWPYLQGMYGGLIEDYE